MDHIEDESLKDTIRADQPAQRNGRVAWQTLVRECRVPDSALTTGTKTLDWHATTIENTVGYCPSTMIDYNRTLTSKAAKFPATAEITSW